MDEFYCSSSLASSSSSSSKLQLEEFALPIPSISISCPNLLLPDSSYSSPSGTRQLAYLETTSERRARLEFLQKEIEKEAMKKEDRARSRVASWVQTQVENSAFLVMAVAAQGQKTRKRRHGRGRKGSTTEPRIVAHGHSGPGSGSPLRFSYVPEREEEEEEGEKESGVAVYYGCGILSPLLPCLSDSQSSYTSNTPTPTLRPSKRSRSRRPRTRRLASSTSSLDSIPEE